MAIMQLEAPVTGAVWKVECAVGDQLEQGQVIMIIESMKMEIPIEAEEAGTILELKVAEGDSVEEDQVVCLIET